MEFSLHNLDFALGKSCFPEKFTPASTRHHRRAAFTPLHLTPGCTRKKLPTPSPVRTLKRAKARAPFQPSPVRGGIFVEPHPKTFSSSVRSGIFHRPSRRCRSYGACIFAKWESTNMPRLRRCWQWETDVGSHAEHPTLCGRCVEAVKQFRVAQLYSHGR